MDIKSLSFAVALIGTALASITVVVAVYRKERGLTLYAAAFVSAIASFLLFMFQGFLPSLIGIVLANILVMFFHFGLAWGLRTCGNLKNPWPRRFWAYAGSWLAIVLAFTYLHDSFVLRASLSSLIIVAAAMEFLLALRQGTRPIPAVIRRSSSAFVVFFMLLHLIRVILLMVSTRSGTRLLDDNFVNAYTFSFTIFTSAMWAGIILALDAAVLLEELERKGVILREMAATDELTGLANRHQFETAVAAEIERASRYGTPLSLILFDIDHFKVVNDTWGHDAGDEVLRRLAAVSSVPIREPDLLFRWGGEEFVILSPHTAQAGAAALAEKLRLSIEACDFPNAGRITASFGVSQWHPGFSREDWFRCADEALYRAKNNGRNRVEVSCAPDVLPFVQVRISWRSEWESGDPTIDAEHRRLIELGNQLLESSFSGAAPKTLKKRVAELIDHVASHFAHEERTLSEVGYPEKDDHAAQHAELVSQALALKNRVEAGECASEVLFDFLVGKVVRGHLIQYDLPFFPYMRSTPPVSE